MKWVHFLGRLSKEKISVMACPTPTIIPMVKIIACCTNRSGHLFSPRTVPWRHSAEDFKKQIFPSSFCSTTAVSTHRFMPERIRNFQYFWRNTERIQGSQNTLNFNIKSVQQTWFETCGIVRYLRKEKQKINKIGEKDNDMLVIPAQASRTLQNRF